jgi:hypothetical protein
LTSSAPVLRASLLIAAAGAIVILLSFLGHGAEAGGAAAIVLAALLTASARKSHPGSGSVRWWKLLAVGALLAVVGVPLSLGLETIGGLIAGAGAALALIAVPFGWR